MRSWVIVKYAVILIIYIIGESKFELTLDYILSMWRPPAAILYIAAPRTNVIGSYLHRQYGILV